MYIRGISRHCYFTGTQNLLKDICFTVVRNIICIKNKILLFAYVSLLLLAGCTNNDQTEKPAMVVKSQPSADTTALKYSFGQIDNTKGLSNSSVNCIFQDSQGLLWIGTWDGLNRYDGNSFRIYRPEPDNKNSLSNQVILKIGEDSAGQLWVLTMHGINRYNKTTDTFTRYYFSKDNRPPMSESQFSMAIDGSGSVFCAVKDWGLGYFDGNSFQLLKNNGFRRKAIKKLEFTPSGHLLALFEDNELQALTIISQNGKKAVGSTSSIASGIRAFGMLRGSNICMVSTRGVAKLYDVSSKQEKLLAQNHIYNIVGEIPKGLVLAGKQGYTVINEHGEEIKKPWAGYLAGHKITTLMQGSEDILWTGTDGDGIFKLHPLQKSFGLVSGSQLPKIDGAIVRSFLKDDGGNFWVGTKGKGVFRLPPDFYTTGNLSPYQSFDEANSSLNNAVYALGKSTDGLIYMGTDGDGITVYDTKTSKIISWEEIEGSKGCDYFKSTYAIYTDTDGQIWLGTNGYGIISCKIERAGQRLKVYGFKRYLAGTEATSLSSNIVFSIIPKDDNQLWIGTRLGGLNLFDKQSGRFTAFKNVPGNVQSLSSNDILCLAKDAQGKLWVGTSYGLNVLEGINGNTALFKNYTVKDGLPNNTIHGLAPARDAGLWISTNFGLANFTGDKFTNYTRSEGLQNNEFADGAAYADAVTGYVFMGGIKGFNYFLPEQIKESDEIPNLFIDRISGQNQPTPYYQGLVIAPDSKSYPSLTLKHNQNFFDIHLAALTFTNNEKCRYAYQLQGFDNGWNNIGNRNVISLTNVPRGRYSLYMKWTNSDGVWSQPVHAIDIRVKPVWWQSNLALIIYGVLSVLFILFVRSYNLKRQSLQQNILIRKNEEELHENRLTFFTNIAHEFLTPLTLIVGPAQKMAESSTLEGKNQKYMHMIQRNASRLLFLTQQLLEFRKAEYDHLKNTVRHFDLVGLIEQIAELFDDWALDKNITYKLDIPAEMDGWFDKDKLEKIVFNLMSNAFKYTPVNGEVQLKCKIESGKLTISVTNTGQGIPKEKMESLFDRFFLSDSNKSPDTEMFRTGIGLAYIKKLVTVLKGDIQVESVPNAETVFTILIPCSKEAFAEKEIDPETAPVLISHHLKNILEETGDKAAAVPKKISALESVEDGRKKILVVEDEKEIHAYLADLLADKYTLITAYNGQEALDSIEKELPDIIISDVMMPVMDGVDLCKKVKTDLRTCHIPFIMLTAKNSVEHRIEGLESGANSYIPKPFYPDHLLVRIQKLLEEKDLILKHFTQDTLVENLPAIPINNDEKAFIKSIIELVRQNVDSENLDSAFIEKTLGISTSQLYRKTKEIFGLSPGDLIRTIRLKYAAELLRKNVLTVSEVCYKSGFNNRSYFYREFKKVYNTTPKNYQLQYQAKTSAFANNAS